MLSALLLLSNFAPERPRDVWVFRSVLDKRARMATAALSKDLWVSYDATNCGLYKAWNGDVKFDGSVYTTEHGPQPTTRGTDIWLGPADRKVWHLTVGGKEIQPRFRGYSLKGDKVTFLFEFELGNKKSAFVRETPEVEPAFTRSFEVEGLPTGATLNLDMGNSAAPGGRWTSSGGGNVGTQLQLKNGRTKLTLIQGPGAPARAATSFRVMRPALQTQEGLTPGLAMRLYLIGEQVSSMPLLVGGQSPNYNVVIPTVDLSTKEHFGGFDEWVYVECTGWIKADEAGDYTFRLTSDDGSILYIGDLKLINNDGLHGAEAKEGKVNLKQGLTPIKIEYFEGSADNVLKLEWKRPGKDTFEVVPEANLASPKGEVKVTAPGKKNFLSPAKRDRPGDGMPLAGVHPSFTLATVRPETFRPQVGGIDFLPDGRMVICNWEPDGGIYALSGVMEKDPSNIKVDRIGFGMAEPLGIVVVKGDIYVLQKQELTRLRDTDKDGKIDEYYCVANGWGVTPNFHEFAFGLVYKDGYFYGNLATAINPGGASTRPQNPDRGKTIQIAMDGSFKYIATGLRTPNGVGLGYGREIFLSDNQGDWLPSSKIMHLKNGAFYGSYSVNPELEGKLKEMLPVVWLPQGEIGNSPGNPIGIEVGPYAKQLVHGDVTHGGVKRVFVEEVGGQLQGAVFRFTQGLEGGVNRIMFGPDKALYIGGIGSSGNWGQEGKERYGLQRLTFNGRPVFEMLAVRAKKNGMEIEFTEPMAPGIGLDPADYLMKQWKYVPTEQYGGPKIDEEYLAIDSVTVSPDRKKVFLETKGLRAEHVVYIKLGHGAHSQSLRPAWSTEAWYTLNKIPNVSVKPNPVKHPGVNVLTAEEKAQGFRLLFDGKSLDVFKGFKRPDIGPAWTVVDGMLFLDKSKGRGADLLTKEQFGDYELRLEWKISPGGNSGIMFHAQDSGQASYLTGPEMQVLDDERAPDGRNPLTSSGALYALKAKRFDMTRPVGAWNEARIVTKGKHLEFWLNGAKVVDIERGGDEWNRLVAESKFKDWAEYGKFDRGHIVIQDHGNPVWYRNIRIRELK